MPILHGEGKKMGRGVPPVIIKKRSEHHVTISTKYGAGLFYNKCTKCGRPVAPMLQRCPICLTRLEYKEVHNEP